MSNKESFLIYKPFYEPIKSLSNEQLGRLFRALFDYQINDKDCNDSDILMAYLFFKNQFVLDDRKYKKIVDRNRNNGSKGGRPKNPNNPVGAKKADNDNDKEKENVKYNENIELIYNSYPNRCVVRGRSTGKSSKCKDKIKTLLKTLSSDKLLETIKWYVDDCKKTNTYMMNFTTFLNNIPDIPEEYKPINPNNKPNPNELQ